MKKVTLLILTLVFANVLSESAFGQWDYSSSAIDNIISSRIDRRRTAARIRARKAATKNRKKSVRKKKAKRVSLNENFIENNYAKVFVAGKKADIV